MKRLLVIAALLSACSCSHAPVASAQHDLSVIRGKFDAAKKIEDDYATLPDCRLHLQIVCWDSVQAEEVRRADYRASKAFTVADMDRTNETIAEARKQVDAFTEAASGLH